MKRIKKAERNFKVSEIDDTVFRLIRSAIFHMETDRITNDNWELVLHELEAQTVLSIPADEFQNIHIEKKMAQAYKNEVMRQVYYWIRLMHEQQNAVNFLKQNGIKCAIIKGAAAAVYYPIPSYRTMGDIDLIVEPQNFKKAKYLFEKQGYQAGHPENERHIGYQKNGIEIELHRKFAVLHKKEEEQYLDKLIYKGLKHTEMVNIEQFTFPMLPKLQNGLVLLTHISQHLEGGLGLRQILDWMMFVDSNLDDQFWYDSFRKEAEKIGLQTLAETTTYMCQKYLGLKTSITWCQDADEVLADQLMEFIMKHGNFGRKDTKSSKTVSIIHYFKRPIILFKTLQKGGCITWKVLEKYPWLKPFAWIYQLLRWLRRGLQRPRAIRSFIKDIRKAKIEDEFLEKLEVVRRRERK